MKKKILFSGYNNEGDVDNDEYTYYCIAVVFVWTDWNE